MITMKIHLLDPRARELINQLEVMDLIRVEYTHQGDQGKPGEMIRLVQENIAEIRTLCQAYKVKRLWLFGSATDASAFHLDSDIDMLYEVNREAMSQREFLDFPLALQRELGQLLGRKIDFVPLQTFRNHYLQQEIDHTKQLIYSHGEPDQEVAA